ncbi:hypothetical protein D3C86_2003170 [compost metagenome]
MRNENTRFAFLNGVANDQYIYLLYSGKKEKDGNQNEGSYIYVYDWNGEPVTKLKLNTNISCFDISKDNNYIFAYAINNKSILKAKINIEKDK